MFFLIAATVVLRAGEFRIVGTDLLGVDFSKALYRAAAREGLGLALALDGTKPGLAVIEAQRADVALMVAAPELEPVLACYEATTVAYHRIVVLVPRSCPIEQLAVEQLAAVFSSVGDPSPTRWADLGAGGTWTEDTLVVAAPEVGTGFSVEFFRHAVLGEQPWRANLTRYTGTAELVRLFAGKVRVIAIAGAPLPETANARCIAVSATTTAPGFLPSPENVHSGDYPLRLPVKLVFRRERAAELRPLLRLLLGDEAAAHFEAAGVVPLPSAQRTRLLAAHAQN